MQKAQTKSRVKETKMAPKARKIKGKDANDNAPEKKSRIAGSAKNSMAEDANDVDDFPTDH